MKIRIRKNVGKRTVSISFRAQTGAEGVALKNAVMSVGARTSDSGMPALIVEKLIENGVDKSDIDLQITTPKTKKGKRIPSGNTEDSR